MTTKEMLALAKKASYLAPALTNEIKNNAIFEMARCIEEDTDKILSANAFDMENARTGSPPPCSTVCASTKSA